MKKTVLIPILSIFALSVLVSGCLKETELRPAPSIAFKTGGEYTSGDITAFAGEKIIVGLECNWNGTDPLRNLAVYVNNSLAGSWNLDDSLSQILNVDTLTLIKSQNETDNWAFQIIDSQGVSSYIGFTISLNTTGNAINQFSRTIGLQENLTEFSYYSLSNNTLYNNSTVRSPQDMRNTIDFLGAFDATNAVHLVSPNANNLPEPYLTNMADWGALKNNTKFCATELIPAQFDYINLDNIIVSSFSTNPNDQKNKAKNLKVDDIYSFKLEDGRYGLFKVTLVTSGVDGKVSIDIKIQD